MAENNNNRKSKRNFSLEKPVERRFDIEKEVEATPVASAKVAAAKPTTPTQPTGKPAQGRFDTSKEPVTKTGSNVPPTGPNVGGDDNNDGGNGSKKWIIIALIIAALAACAYIFMGGNKSDETTAPNTPQIEQNDSTQNDENATEDIGNTIDDAPAEDQASDNKSERTSAPQASELKQLTPATNSASNTPSNSSGVSSQPASSTSSSSIEQKAKDVWNGVYGNNPDRRKNLGSDYEEVQRLVNKMHRQGLK
jgi:hypothetical protein